MCLLLIAHGALPEQPLVLLANRDEFHARPTAPLDFWDDAPRILAGRDLLAGGTWLGVTRDGRLAALTNYREPGAHRSGAPSRGELVRGYLEDDAPPLAWLEALAVRDDAYNGFNLICGDLTAPPAERLAYHGNRGDRPRPLAPGLYGLSNHLLDTPWPKVRRGKAGLRAALDGGGPLAPEPLLDLLADARRAPDAELPDTGVGLARERILSPMFIPGLEYGTRSSTVILMDARGGLTVAERSFSPAADGPRPSGTRLRTLDAPPRV